MLDHPHENHSLNLNQLACNKSTSSLISFLRYCKEIANLLFWLIWACLATPAWNDTITFMKPSTFMSMEKINFNLHVFLDILQKYFKPVVLGTLGMFGYVYPKWKLSCLSAGKKSTPSFMLLRRYCKDMQTYFGYFGHAWLHSPKMIVLTCRRLRCLSACKK